MIVTHGLNAFASQTAGYNHSSLDIGNDSNDTTLITHFSSTAEALISSSCFSAMSGQTYFHLPHAIMFICYMLPFGSPSRLVLFIRIGLACATIIMALWARYVQCWANSFLWNVASTVVNVIYIIVLFYQLKPIRFDEEIEEVYLKIFHPLNVSRKQFKKIIPCMKTIRLFEPFEVYAEEKVTEVDNLSLLLSGKFIISQSINVLNIIFPYQFLDSPEWFNQSTDKTFQVSVIAMEYSKVLFWDRSDLIRTIITDSFFNAIFDHILGRDVVNKLTQISECMLYRHLPDQFLDSEEEEMVNDLNFEQQTIYYLKSIEAILKRELQDDPNGRRLNKTEETDFETST